MKFHEKIAAVIAFAVIFPVSAADTYTWIPGSTDWASPDSYVEDGKPGQGDIVLIPDGKVATNKVTSVDDESGLASFEAFSKLAAVYLASNKSKIVLDIGEGVSLTNNCRIICYANGKQLARQGTIEKIGLGSLEFGTQTASSGYNCGLIVKEGLLALPQEMTVTTLYLGSVVVSNGATLVTALDAARGSSIGDGATYMASLSGGGDLTNRYVGANRIGLNDSYTTSTFSGRIRRGISIFPSAKSTHDVVLNLTGTESDTTSYTYVSDYTTIGAAKFGMAGEPSSIGKAATVYWRGAGTFKYLGVGEDTTDKNFYTWTNTDYPLCINGGNGGLTMTGILSCDTTRDEKEIRGMLRLSLAGDGPLTNVFAGTLPTWTCQTTNYNFHITKKGAGIWRFADKAQTHANAWTVENGTLQFESLKQRGVACSLGTANKCFESYTGLVNTNKCADWAFALGGASTEGTMEYVGSEDVLCTTRPILLKGMGGTLKNSSSNRFVFDGVSADSGASATLTLAGDTAATNEIWNVTNGKGTTALVKDGSGTWVLGGTNNVLSGGISLKAGTLIVRNPSEVNYDWFRWTVKERGQPNSDQLNFRVQEFGIYDGDNKRMNAKLTTYASYGTKKEGTLPAGMAGYWHPKMTTESNSTRPLMSMFDDGDTTWNGGNSSWTQVGLPNGEMSLADDSTWVPVVMHLTDNKSRAATFDAAQRTSGSSYYAYKTFSMEGSIDGIHWDSLTNVTLTSFAQNAWSFNGGNYSSGNSDTHTGGCPIAGGPKGTANALEGVSSVSVAAGARLVAQGAATIPGLTVDASGAGTIDGFAFAENGTLTVNNLPKNGGALPGTYVNCTGLENVENWTLSNGDSGRELSSWSISVKDGVITLIPPGAVLIVE